MRGIAPVLASIATMAMAGANDAASSTTVQDLIAVQRQVQSALPIVRSALVALETSDGAASGVIVTPEGLVLTAAHVVSDPDRRPVPGLRVKVFLHDGRRVEGKALGMDVATDAAMVQLEGGRKDWPFVPLQRGDASFQPGDWCFALGHPGGYDQERGEVLRVGKILKSTANSIQTDCVLMGGDSGGPLFNLQAELIGIHSQIWEGRDQNVHVSLAPYFRSWDIMKESEIVRVWGQGSGGWLGLATRSGTDGRLEVADVASGSPAARAGLRAGDTLLSLDKRAMATQSQFSAAIRARAAGDSVVLLVRNRSGERIVTVKLAQRPDE